MWKQKKIIVRYTLSDYAWISQENLFHATFGELNLLDNEVFVCEILKKNW